jgi:hypothetical protein
MKCFKCLHMEVAQGTPAWFGKCSGCGLATWIFQDPEDVMSPEAIERQLGPLQMIRFDHRCCMCGGLSGLRKHEIVVSSLAHEEEPHCRPVDSFQRHLCEFCAPKAADFLMAVLDARERSL